ncbi:heavy-metal-associated domain-containing protein [Candidatus Woesearchaeota archaeon]|nr:heavy-metal-associated domain-containing protein [Candidatus Woesearchaeota archaeon]
MKLNLKVHGMHCSSCEVLIKDALNELQSVSNVKVSAAKGELFLEFDEKQTSLDAIKKVIQKEGYKVVGGV